jgi:hypothetical protein
MTAPASRNGCLGIRLAVWLPALYLTLAIYVWVDFARLPPDGLANLGLMLVTAPVALAGLLIGAISGASDFVLLPSGHGYLTDHAIYYVPAVAITAIVLWLFGGLIDRVLVAPRD